MTSALHLYSCNTELNTYIYYYDYELWQLRRDQKQNANLIECRRILFQLLFTHSFIRSTAEHMSPIHEHITPHHTLKHDVRHDTAENHKREHDLPCRNNTQL